ncbi:hypothetical protein K435DRAFT_960594 [Dendrothele bispora CBS 962.96]|uniref:DUF7918 domain-containing protein n=1 Tax=Dendrothele bispora (strain CBS 962.96) TaxID=1314807 RepID=A0A4V4HIE8_DENBC|nr:hypothetical protein K435DRAFT_960594 [Dendrothele bispora CBS 962.96]
MSIVASSTRTPLHMKWEIFFSGHSGSLYTMVLYCNDFHAWVTINDEEAQEFQCEVLEEDNGLASDRPRDMADGVMCWIPSQEGKRFKVHWHDSKFSHPSRGRVYIDGISCGGKVIHDKNRLQVVKDGYRIGPSSKRPFLFQKIDSIRPDAASPSSCSSSNSPLTTRSSSTSGSAINKSGPAPASSSDIGKIYLEIHHVKPVSKRPYDSDKTLIPPENQYTEEETKGKVHQVRFGEPVATQTLPTYHETETIGPPVARFCFRYAPLGLLRAKNIAPLSRTTRKHTSGQSSEPLETGDTAVKNEPDSEGTTSVPRVYLKDIEVDVVTKLEPDVQVLQGSSARGKRKDPSYSPTLNSGLRRKKKKAKEIIDLTSD